MKSDHLVDGVFLRKGAVTGFQDEPPFGPLGMHDTPQDAVSLVTQAFSPLRGLPAWNVRRGHGTFLTLEFGSPHLVIREPRVASAGSSKKVRKILARRLVKVTGDWHLWIYCCNWRIDTGGKILADNEASDRRIDRAAKDLDGQCLVDVVLDPATGMSAFTFDLGATLQTWPWERPRDEPSEQWMFFIRGTGDVLTWREDGCYSLGPGNRSPEDHVWLPL
jgi:hypothetical protein